MRETLAGCVEITICIFAEKPLEEVPKIEVSTCAISYDIIATFVHRE
jgi:hypothetical protein